MNAQPVVSQNTPGPRRTMTAITGGGRTLDKAHHQWATRPKDERYDSFPALLDAVRKRRDISKSGIVHTDAMSVKPDAQHGLVVVGSKGVPTKFTNWSFSQLCRLVGSPTEYLVKKSPELAAANLNDDLDRNSRELKALVTTNGDGIPQLRAVNSPSYSRLWDATALEWIEDLTEGGNWKLPLAYKDGQWHAELVPSGAYSSDRDCFLFMVDESRPLEVLGRQLSRGFFFWNSEVGSQTVGMDMFLYDYVCSNHYVWGAHMIAEVRRRHIGEMLQDRAYRDIRKMIDVYANTSTEKEIAAIKKASTVLIDEPLDFLRKNDFTKGEAKASIEAAVREEGDSRSLWHLVMGATAAARVIPHRDRRVDLERRAGRLLESVL